MHYLLLLLNNNTLVFIYTVQRAIIQDISLKTQQLHSGTLSACPLIIATTTTSHTTQPCEYFLFKTVLCC